MHTNMRPILTLPDARDMITSTGARLPDRLAGKIGYGQDQQSNIKLAFERIRSCFTLIEKKIKDPPVMQKLELYLQKSLMAYEAGEDQAGDRYFIMFESIAFPENYKGAVIPSDWDW